MSDSDRFWNKVIKTPMCWLWKDAKGYGLFNVVDVSRNTKQRSVRAHRYAYQTVKGPLSRGKVLDHLCRIPSCVNPEHLEEVSSRENTHRSVATVNSINSRKIVCAHGHPFSQENTYRYPLTKRFPMGRRECRICRKAMMQAFYLKYGRRKNTKDAVQDILSKFLE